MKMRLTKKKIEEIIMSILGEEGLKIIDELSGKENVSEFDLAKKINKNIKIVRRMLYMLYNHNLVGFHRKKDKQKGWYIYYWTLLPENIKFTYLKRKKKLVSSLKIKLEEEQKELFFICPDNCVRLNFDRAMDFDFRCPECGKLLSQDENKKKIQYLKKRIAVIEEELKKAETIRIKEVKEVKEIKEVKTRIEKKETQKKKVKKKSSPKKKKIKIKISTKRKTVKKVTSKKKIVKKKNIKKKTTKKKISRKKK